MPQQLHLEQSRQKNGTARIRNARRQLRTVTTKICARTDMIFASSGPQSGNAQPTEIGWVDIVLFRVTVVTDLLSVLIGIVCVLFGHL
jgi:hypothetical protein